MNSQMRPYVIEGDGTHVHAGAIPVVDADQVHLPQNVGRELRRRHLHESVEDLSVQHVAHRPLVPVQQRVVLEHLEAEEPQRAVFGKQVQRLHRHAQQLFPAARALLRQHPRQIQVAREVLGGGRDRLGVLERRLLIAELREDAQSLHHDLHRLLRVHGPQLAHQVRHVLHRAQSLLHAQSLLEEQLAVRVQRARGLQHHARVAVLATLHLQATELHPHLDGRPVLHRQLHEDAARRADVTHLLLLDARVDAATDDLRLVRALVRQQQPTHLRRGKGLPDASVDRRSPQLRQRQGRRVVRVGGLGRLVRQRLEGVALAGLAGLARSVFGGFSSSGELGECVWIE